MKHLRVRAAGILFHNNKILLVKHKKDEKEYWLLPGGGVDFGETFQESIEREFLEEANIKVRAKNMVFVSESIDPEHRRHIINIVFEVDYLSGKIKLGDEDILSEIKYVDLTELNNYTLYPNIKAEILKYAEEKDKNVKYLGNRWE